MSSEATDNRSYPSRPYLGVSALLFCGEEIVLVQRGNAPMKGFWTLPGGAVEIGETLQQAIARELDEELGLDCQPTEIGDLVEILRKDDQGRTQRHFVIAVFVAEISKCPLLAGDDAAKACWVSMAELSNFQLTEGTEVVIQQLMAGQRLGQPAS